MQTMRWFKDVEQDKCAERGLKRPWIQLGKHRMMDFMEIYGLLIVVSIMFLPISSGLRGVS